MTSISYKILERRQKIHTRVYIVLCLILLAASGFYSYKKWQEYNFISEGVAQNTELVSLLREEVKIEKNNYETEKNGFDNLNNEIEEKLSSIFPTNDNYTALTRQMDAFEKDLAKKNDIFEISNIDYQTPIENENYSVLPMRMNIRSSSENFTKFLHLVENSGALDSDIRLMDISSIRLNFEEDGGGEDKNINFSVQINAYFQK